MGVQRRLGIGCPVVGEEGREGKWGYWILTLPVAFSLWPNHRGICTNHVGPKWLESQVTVN